MDKTEGYYVVVNGDLAAMQALSMPLNISLNTLAEGTISRMRIEQRVALARRVTSAYAENLDELSDLVTDISLGFGGTPNSYTFKQVGDPAVDSILTTFTRKLADYHFGLEDPRTLTEEAHTAIENLMNLLLGKKYRDIAFRSKVEKCIEDGYLDPSSRDSILGLKNLRRGGKHRGQLIAEKEINKILPKIIQVAHQLCDKARRRKPRPLA